jgi:hypothetical protein
MKPQYKISSDKKVEKLQHLIIQERISKHTLVKENALLPEETARALAEHFVIKWDDDDTPLVQPKEKVLSNHFAGTWAGVDETIETLFQGEYSTFLRPANEETHQGEESPAGTIEEGYVEQLEQIRANYQAARQRGDGPAMVASKRAAASMGEIIL